MLLIGLWVDKNEPDMNLFLSPFIKEANELSTNGLQWHLDENTIITSLVIPGACRFYCSSGYVKYETHECYSWLHILRTQN